MATPSNIQSLRRSLGEKTAAALSRLGSSSDRTVLLRGTAGSFGVKAISNGLLFAAQLLFANYLGADGFGTYVLALAWMNILLLIGRQGFDLATVRYVASYRADGRWDHLCGFLRASTGIVFAGSALASLLLVGFCLVAGDRLGDEYYLSLMVVAGIIPLFALLQIKAATLRGLGNIVLGDIPHAIVHPVALIVVPLIGVSVFGISSSPSNALIAFLISIALSLAVVWALSRRYLPPELSSSKPVFRWREWMLTAPAMTLIAGFGIVLNQIGIIMLGGLTTAADAGIFSASTRIACSLQLVVFALVSALSPMVARLHAAQDLTGLQRAIGTTSRLVFTICLAGAVVLLVTGEWIIGWFGAEFSQGYTVMVILLAGQLFWAANAPAAVILNMSGRHNVSAILLASAVVLDLLLSALLIPSMGAMGAAVANTVTIVLWNIASATCVYRSLGIRSWVWFRDHSPRAVTA